MIKALKRPTDTGSRIALLVVLALLVGTVILFPIPCEASRFYYAAPRTAAKRILAKGIDSSKFRVSGRFREKLYGSKLPSTAIAEKGKRSAVLRFKTRKNLEHNALDLRNPTASKLRSLLGKKIKLRGKVKNKIIGPKLGHKLGQMAEKKDKVILFRSAKTGGTNLAIQEKTLKEHPQIARPEKIVQQSLR